MYMENPPKDITKFSLFVIISTESNKSNEPDLTLINNFVWLFLDWRVQKKNNENIMRWIYSEFTRYSTIQTFLFFIMHDFTQLRLKFSASRTSNLTVVDRISEQKVSF